jgi:hypothetical protein
MLAHSGGGSRVQHHGPRGAPGLQRDNITFYLALVAVVRFTVLTSLWWIERIVITDKRVMLAHGFCTRSP